MESILEVRDSCMGGFQFCGCSNSVVSPRFVLLLYRFVNCQAPAPYRATRVAASNAPPSVRTAVVDLVEANMVDLCVLHPQHMHPPTCWS